MMNNKPFFRLFIFLSMAILSAALQGCGLIEAIVGPIAERSEICALPVFVVTKTEDTFDNICTESDCSLRDAIFMANECEGEQTIEVPAGLYVLVDGGLGITDDLVIHGEGAIIDGNGIDRAFILNSKPHVELRGLTIQNGAVHGDGGGDLRRL